MKFKLIFTVIFCQLLFGQQRVCGMRDHMNSMMFNPMYKKQHIEQQEKFKAELARLNNSSTNRNQQTTNSTIKIPVAVHYPDVSSTASESLKNCLRNYAQNVINILNADYNATNNDISNWSSASNFYPGTNVGSLNIEFILAKQNHPANSGLSNGETAVTFGTSFTSGDTDTNWKGYMNFVCKNLTGGILGYSPLGGSPGSGQTVVMDNNSFGNDTNTCTGYVPNAPFNLGRTLTHELGHFFNLDHTFAFDDGCGTDDDGISDTPKVGNATYGCPNNGSISGCGTIPALTMNYMDYVDDACMYMFTAQQANIMKAWYNTIQSQFAPNVIEDGGIVVTPPKNGITITPIPVSSDRSLNIDFIGNYNNVNIKVYDLQAKLVFEEDLGKISKLNHNIDLSNKGIFFLVIDSNESVITKKIIIE